MFGSLAVQAAPVTLLVDARSGEVLKESAAGRSWFPASLTKMMNAYTTLHAIKSGRLTIDHPLKVTVKAQRQAPSKMGFKAGTLITVENALKIIMVKSANDVSMTLAEGISGNHEAFIAEMNSHTQRLGMNGTRFVNANGLPARGQVTTARDMAILARALMIEFSEYAYLWEIPAHAQNSKYSPKPAP
jgi:D-alanyl-D-alanine carboxypeptidase